MFSLVKYIGILLLLFGGFSVMQANKTGILESKKNRAVEILEYVYASKLNKPTVICQNKSYNSDEFVKCYDTDASFWKVDSSKEMHIVAVNTHAARVVQQLGAFKELRIDNPKINDKDYNQALQKLFQ